MSLTYERFPPLRFPCVLPLYNETCLQAQQRMKMLVDHYRRCDYVEPVVDDGPPRCTVNVRSRLKKLLVDGERLARVEKDNRYMLMGILKTMRGPGSVDHYHKKILPCHTSTLNYVKRKQTIDIINTENKSMMKRILDTKTSYDHVKLELAYRCKHRSRRGRSHVFKIWNAMADQRRQFLKSGKCLVESYNLLDNETLREKTEQTHRNCFLQVDFEPIRLGHVPRSSRVRPGSAPVDHRRCFTPVFAIPVYRPSPHPPKISAEGDFPVRGNRTMKLRAELLKKILEIPTKPAAVTRPHPTPPRPSPRPPPSSRPESTPVKKTAKIPASKQAALPPSPPPSPSPHPCPSSSDFEPSPPSPSLAPTSSDRFPPSTDRSIFSDISPSLDAVSPSTIPPISVEAITPSADLPSADLPSTDFPLAGSLSADRPVPDLTLSDLPSADLPLPDLSSADFPSADLASSDLTSADFPPPEPVLPSADLPSTDPASSDLPPFADLPSDDLPFSSDLLPPTDPALGTGSPPPPPSSPPSSGQALDEEETQQSEGHGENVNQSSSALLPRCSSPQRPKTSSYPRPLKLDRLMTSVDPSSPKMSASKGKARGGKKKTVTKHPYEQELKQPRTPTPVTVFQPGQNSQRQRTERGRTATSARPMSSGRGTTKTGKMGKKSQSAVSLQTDRKADHDGTATHKGAHTGSGKLCSVKKPTSGKDCHIRPSTAASVSLKSEKRGTSEKSDVAQNRSAFVRTTNGEVSFSGRFQSDRSCNRVRSAPVGRRDKSRSGVVSDKALSSRGPMTHHGLPTVRTCFVDTEEYATNNGEDLSTSSAEDVSVSAQDRHELLSSDDGMDNGWDSSTDCSDDSDDTVT